MTTKDRVNEKIGALARALDEKMRRVRRADLPDIAVEFYVAGVAIGVENFADYHDDPYIIMLDLEEPEDPILLVWADIEQEDPTHRISLKGAAIK